MGLLSDLVGAISYAKTTRNQHESPVLRTCSRLESLRASRQKREKINIAKTRRKSRKTIRVQSLGCTLSKVSGDFGRMYLFRVFRRVFVYYFLFAFLALFSRGFRVGKRSYTLNKKPNEKSSKPTLNSEIDILTNQIITHQCYSCSFLKKKLRESP